MALESFEGIQSIAISDCVVDESNIFQMRQQYKPEIIAAIKTSLENGKMFQPIAVTLSEDKEHYIIVDGTHRFKAAKELGWKEISATFLNEDEAKQWGLTANILRNDYNAVEKAKALLKLKELLKITKDEELSKKVGLKKSMVSKYLKINSLPDKIKDKAVKVDYFSYQKLYALAKATKLTKEQKIEAFNLMYNEYVEKNTEEKKKDTSKPKATKKTPQQRIQYEINVLRNRVLEFEKKINTFLKKYEYDEGSETVIFEKYNNFCAEYEALAETLLSLPPKNIKGAIVSTDDETETKISYLINVPTNNQITKRLRNYEKELRGKGEYEEEIKKKVNKLRKELKEDQKNKRAYEEKLRVQGIKQVDIQESEQETSEKSSDEPIENLSLNENGEVTSLKN